MPITIQLPLLMLMDLILDSIGSPISQMDQVAAKMNASLFE